MTFAMRRHQLIDEAKSELDVAYEEVRRAENKIMDLEHEYNSRCKVIERANGGNQAATIARMMSEKESVQESLDLGHLYKLQNIAVERFAMISSAFTIVGSVEEDSVSVDLMRNILFRKSEVQDHKIRIDAALRDFSRGLHAYSREDASAVVDEKVRNAWAEIEDLLRDFGRNI